MEILYFFFYPHKPFHAHFKSERKKRMHQKLYTERLKMEWNWIKLSRIKINQFSNALKRNCNDQTHKSAVNFNGSPRCCCSVFFFVGAWFRANDTTFWPKWILTFKTKINNQKTVIGRLLLLILLTPLPRPQPKKKTLKAFIWPTAHVRIEIEPITCCLHDVFFLLSTAYVKLI